MRCERCICGSHEPLSKLLKEAYIYICMYIYIYIEGIYVRVFSGLGRSILGV